MADPGPIKHAAAAPAAEDAVEHVAGSLAAGVILLCDHAANALPEGYGTLGLPEAELARHIAHDIGAREVTAGIAARLGAPAVMTRYSRLLIDCNRGEDDPTLIMRLSDGAIVPGNRTLTVEERARRLARFYRPYHAAVTALIDQALAEGTIPVLLSMHSFTPVWRGVHRPWHAAMLWDKDPRLAAPLLAALRTEPGLVVGDNEPYSGALKGDCLWQHGTSRGLAHALVEVRQDLIAAADGQAAWAARLAEATRRILADAGASPDLRTIKHHGSHTD
ncbi:MAG: N-formylglutamate amidohydrolase [Hyphomicrobium sp.]|uniref:N-formylglutamate amidohydrolase n=1 Tax=Hyphomicrobium sp. TaxID=82 RepID=UPI003D120D64